MNTPRTASFPWHPPPPEAAPATFHGPPPEPAFDAHGISRYWKNPRPSPRGRGTDWDLEFRAEEARPATDPCGIPWGRNLHPNPVFIDAYRCCAECAGSAGTSEHFGVESTSGEGALFSQHDCSSDFGCGCPGSCRRHEARSSEGGPAPLIDISSANQPYVVCNTYYAQCGRPPELTYQEMLEKWPSENEALAAFEDLTFRDTSPNPFGTGDYECLQSLLAWALALLRKTTEVILVAACSAGVLPHRIAKLVSFVNSKIEVSLTGPCVDRMYFGTTNDHGDPVFGICWLPVNNNDVLMMESIYCSPRPPRHLAGNILLDSVIVCGNMGRTARTCMEVERWTMIAHMASTMLHELAHPAGVETTRRHQGNQCDKIYMLENIYRYYLMTRTFNIIGSSANCADPFLNRSDVLREGVDDSFTYGLGMLSGVRGNCNVISARCCHE